MKKLQCSYLMKLLFENSKEVHKDVNQLKRTAKYSNLSALSLMKQTILISKKLSDKTEEYSSKPRIDFIPPENGYNSANQNIYSTESRTPLNQQPFFTSPVQSVANTVPKKFGMNTLHHQEHNTNFQTYPFDSGQIRKEPYHFSAFLGNSLTGTNTAFVQQQLSAPANFDSYSSDWNSKKPFEKSNLKMSLLPLPQQINFFASASGSNNNESLLFSDNENYRKQLSNRFDVNILKRNADNDFENLLNHNKKKPSKAKKKLCCLCQRALSSKFALENHMRTHTHEKPFCCTFINCQKCFSTAFNRDRHIKTHEKALSNVGISVDEFKSNTLKKHHMD